MVNKFYTKTIIPVPTIDYKLIWPNAATDLADTIPRWKTYPNYPDIWDTDTTKLLASVGITPTLIRIFRWAPNKTFNWHVDGSFNNITQFAINWILDGAGTIEWSPNLILPQLEDKFKNLAFGALPSKEGDSHLAECSTDGNGCLVNTTIPHRVVNKHDIHRVTVSILFNNNLTYDYAAAKLLDAGLTL